MSAQCSEITLHGMYVLEILMLSNNFPQQPTGVVSQNLKPCRMK